MQAIEIPQLNWTAIHRKNGFNKIVTFALFEAGILLVSLAFVEFICIRLDSVSLPVSLENGSVISLQAAQSITMQELLWPILIIAMATSIFATYVYARYFLQASGSKPEKQINSEYA